MSSEERNKFGRISEKDGSEVSGGNVAMIYKPGTLSRWVVIDPGGRIECKCWTKYGAFDEAQKLSQNSPGCCRGAVRELTSDEYENLLKQKRIQKIL